MTFYLVDACNEVGPNDVVCCEVCFRGSTVKATEMELDRHNDDAPVCSCCKVTGCAHCGETNGLVNYNAEHPSSRAPEFWLCDNCSQNESERRNERAQGEAWGAGFAENH